MIANHLPAYITILPLFGALLIPITSRKRSEAAAVYVSLVVYATTLVLALIVLFHTHLYGPEYYRFGGWSSVVGVTFRIDAFTALAVVLVLLLTLLIDIYNYHEATDDIATPVPGGFRMLVMIMAFSMIGMIYTDDLFNMYVFMEILSITSCAIVTISRNPENLYAGLKYLIIGTVGSVTVLFGIATLYMVSGSLNMSVVGSDILSLWDQYPINVRVALALMLTGFAIKAAIFPLHTWLPDAHSSAPTPSSALLSGIVVKVYLIGAIKLLLVVFGADLLGATLLPRVIGFVGLSAMIFGSAFALGQTKVKRILAYSTVAHLGYIIVGVSLLTPEGTTAGLFHLVAHATMKTGLFLAAGLVIHHTGKSSVEEFAGVGYRMPFTMTVFTICALGMIGIPGTAGFMSKWYLITAAIDATRPIIVPIVLVSSFMNALYYLPLVSRAFMQRTSATDHIMERDRLPGTTKIPLSVISLIIVVTGLFPQLLMSLLRVSTGTLI